MNHHLVFVPNVCSGFFSRSTAAFKKISLLLPAVALAFAGSAQGAPKTWDPGLSGSSSNGSGTWDIGTTADWGSGGVDTTFSGVADTASVGVNGGPINTSYTITVAPGVTTSGLTLNAMSSGSSYTFSGGQLNLSNGVSVALTASNSATFNDFVNMTGNGNTTSFAATGATLTFNAGGTITTAVGSTTAIGQGSSIVLNSGVYNLTAFTVNGGIGNAGTLGTTTGTSGGYVFNNGAAVSSGAATASFGYSKNALATVDGGALTDATYLVVGRAQSAGLSSRVVLNTGSITATQTLINFNGSGAGTFGGELDINGGTFNDTAVASPVSINSGSTGGAAILNVTGGLLNVGQINLNDTFNGTTLSTGGSATLTMTGGALFLGSATAAGAINDVDPSGTTYAINLSNATLGATGTWTSALNMSLGSTASTTFDSANIAGTGAPITLSGVLSGTGTAGIVKIGTGTLTLSGSNTYVGSTTINQGTLTLDFANSATTTNLIKSGNALILGGGGLNLTGKASTTNSETFGTTTINAGASAFTINNSATANPDSVTLGTITRNVGGTVTFTLPTSGTNSATNGYATSTGTASTILTDAKGSAYATVGTTDWAAKDATNGFVVGLSSISGGYTVNTASTLTGNADVTTASTTLTANASPTSIRMNNAAADTIALGGKILTTGGILVGTGAGSVTETISGTGTLEGSSGGDLVIINNSGNTTSGLNISSNIGDNTTATGLTISGSGVTAISGTNNYTGATTINAASTLKLLGGTLSGGGAFTSTGTFTQSGGVISGATSVTVNGGTTTLAGLNTFTGPVSVSGNSKLLTTSLNSVSGGTASSSLGAPTSVANGTITLGSGVTSGTLVYNGATAATTDRVISLGGTIGGGILDQSATAAVLLKYTSDLTVTGTGPKTLTLQGSTTGSGEFAGAIVNGSADTTSLTKLGTGTWTVSGVDTYTGSTTISAGALLLTGTLGSGTPSAIFGGVGGTAISSATTFTESGSGLITGASALTVTAGTTTLNNVNSYTGGTTVSSTGTIIVGNIGALGSTQDPVRLNGGTLDLKTDTSVNAYNILTGGSGTITSDRATSGTAGITQTLGTLTFGVSGNTVTIAAGSNTNASLGTPAVAFGAVLFDTQVATASTGTLTVNSGAIATVASAQAFAASGTTDTLALAGASTGTNTVTGVISNGSAGGTLALTKTGAGLWILGGADTYTGLTTLGGGTLNLASASALNTTALTGGITFTGGTLQYTASSASGADYSTKITGSTTAAISIDTNGQIVAFGGAIPSSNTDGLTKLGAGTLALNGANLNTGTTTIAAGTLNLGNAASLNTLALNSGIVFSGGTLQYTAASAAGVDYSSKIANSSAAMTVDTNGQNVSFGGILASSNSHGLNKVGSGTLTLANASNAYTGVNTLTNGNLAISAAGDLGASTNTLLFNGGTLELLASNSVGLGGSQTTTITGGTTATFQVDAGSNLTLNAAVGETAMSGAVNKTGSGTLTYNASNTYTGTTTITAGIIDYNNGSAFATSPITVLSGATAKIEDLVASGTPSINITGPGAGSAGALESAGGDGNLYAGLLSLGGNAAISSDTSGALFWLSNTGTITGPSDTLTVQGAGDTEIDSVIGTGAGGLTKNDAGTLALYGANTYTGPTVVNGGTLQADVASVGGTSGAFGNNSAVTLANTSGVSMDLNSNNTQIGSLTGGGSNGGNVTLGTATLTTGGDNSSPAPYAGVISGMGSFVKIGAGAQTLSGVNTYSGGTTVSGGTLYVNGGVSTSSPSTTTSGIGSGAVMVNAGGILAGNGNITTSAGVTVASGGSIASGALSQLTASPAISPVGGLTFTNTAVTLNSGNLTFQLGSGSTSGTAINRTDFTVANNNTTFLTLAGSSSINFAGTSSISLVDLTNGALQMTQGTPYLLVVDSLGLNTAYGNLVTMTGSGPTAAYSIDGNGYVVGVAVGGYTGGSTINSTNFTPITINEYGSGGVSPLNANNNYFDPVLYLNNGDLEVVPEPGTWALMLGGLALLVVIQRRRRRDA